MGFRDFCWIIFITLGEPMIFYNDDVIFLVGKLLRLIFRGYVSRGQCFLPTSSSSSSNSSSFSPSSFFSSSPLSLNKYGNYTFVSNHTQIPTLPITYFSNKHTTAPTFTQPRIAQHTTAHWCSVVCYQVRFGIVCNPYKILLIIVSMTLRVFVNIPCLFCLPMIPICSLMVTIY